MFTRGREPTVFPESVQRPSFWFHVRLRDGKPFHEKHLGPLSRVPKAQRARWGGLETAAWGLCHRSQEGDRWTLVLCSPSPCYSPWDPMSKDGDAHSEGECTCLSSSRLQPTSQTPPHLFPWWFLTSSNQSSRWIITEQGGVYCLFVCKSVCIGVCACIYVYI